MAEMPMTGELGQGHFIKQTYKKQTTLDKNGRPVDEVYQTKAHGAIGNGNRVVDRQQMYHNSGTGYQKASHERMLNGQGRKVIKEQAGNQFNSYDHYKNMGSEDLQNFDQ